MLACFASRRVTSRNTALVHMWSRLPPPALNHCYAMLCDVYRKSVMPICDNMARFARAQHEWKGAQEKEDVSEARRAAAESALAQVRVPGPCRSLVAPYFPGWQHTFPLDSSGRSHVPAADMATRWRPGSHVRNGHAVGAI